MTAGDFVRIQQPSPFAGMSGTLVGLCIGDESTWWVRLTSTGQHVAVAASDLRRDKRTSELRAEARERIQSGVPVRGIRERLKGAAA